MALSLCLHTSLGDGDTSRLGEVVISDARAQAPDDDSVPIPVIPLPHRRPTSASQAPVSAPLAEAPPRTPPDTTSTTTTTTEKGGEINVPLLFEKHYQNEDGSYFFE